MSTVAVVTSQHADEQWVSRVIDGALVLVDAAPLADVIVVSEDCLAAIGEHVKPDATLVVLGDPMAPAERATHVVTRRWTDSALRALLVTLASGPEPEPPSPPPPTNPDEARDAQRAINAARKLAAAVDLVGCETTTVEILLEMIGADRAYCLFYDHGDASLWSETKLQSAAGDDRRAITGLAGYAARTGRVTHASRAGDDPRFVGAIDDPDGDSNDRLVAQPVFGSDGQIHAVLVCVRRARRPDFAASELALLARFARLVTPILDQLSIHVQAQSILEEEAGGGLFRTEVAASLAIPRWGDVIRVSPRWLRWAYWLLVVLLAASVVFVAFGTVSTYSSGPAVVRSTARTAINASIAGNVAAVEVESGQVVAVGAVIARLDDTEQRAAVDRLEREFETQLRNHMLDPGDVSADSALRSVRNSLDAARVALGERLIRAPIAGEVGDVRVRPGQRVNPGDLIAFVLDNQQGLDVIALLPGEDRPQLSVGMTMRLELHGYRYAYRSIVIESVSADVLGPAEARRVLGAEIADNFQLAGPVVLVRGRIPSAEFVIDDRTLRYHDGMIGAAEVRVREEPIIFALIPATRRFR